MATLFGLCLVFAAVQLDARRCAEVARERAATLALTAGIWLDGDAHAGLGQDPRKRLEDLGATLAMALEANEYPGEVRTLRPRPEVKTAVAASPDAPRAGALEIVLDTASKAANRSEDYRPEMAQALFEGHGSSVVRGGRVLAYAPVLDSWGATTAIVCVGGPATAPLWRQLLFWIVSGIFGALLVSFALFLARRVSDRLELCLSTLESGVRQLASGRIPSAFGLARSAPSEFTTLAEALEAVRLRLEAQAMGQPLPQPPANGAEDSSSSGLGEASEFDLGLLLQQLADSAKKVARARGVELQLVFPDGVPSQLVGYPMALYRALEALMRKALETTARGRITLRVHRASDGGAGERLRFEVADTGPGIHFKDQPDLAAALAEAVQFPPDSHDDPLLLASALAHALGGELSFESQPGQGTRFGFTASLQPVGPLPATAFQPRPALVPPESAFVSRQALGLR